MTRRRSVLATLDAAADLAVHRGLATSCGWYLCRDPAGGYAAWVYTEIEEPSGVPDVRSIEEASLLDNIPVCHTAEEAAQALLDWVEEQQPDLGVDVGWS